MLCVCMCALGVSVLSEYEMRIHLDTPSKGRARKG